MSTPDELAEQIRAQRAAAQLAEAEIQQCIEVTQDLWKSYGGSGELADTPLRHLIDLFGFPPVLQATKWVARRTVEYDENIKAIECRLDFLMLEGQP